MDDHGLPGVPGDGNILPNKVSSTGEYERVRWFLVCFAAFLAVLGFIAFLVMKDVWVLVGDSVFVVPIFAVYAYYFPRQSLR